jgi:hypothetical protein
MKANIHGLSGIQTHDLRVQGIKAFASDRATTGTGNFSLCIWASLGVNKQYQKGPSSPNKQ